MVINKNPLLFSSIALLSVSFLSACGKSEDSKYSSQKNQEAYQNSVNGGRFCTDLDDAVKNPISKYQWHLKNTGQSSFASTQGVPGEDINVASVLKDKCLSGKGVYVAVVDSGMELDHPSLAPNIDNRPFSSKTWSVNFRRNNLQQFNPSPVPDDGADHGTMVSGIIAMRSNLGYGGSGVAPRASLSGYNIIQDDTQNFQNFFDSLGGSKASEKNDIFSMSYGDNNTRQMSDTDPLELASMAMYRLGARTLREGKGAIYVKAAGNGFYSLGFGADCTTATNLGLSCQDSSMNLDNSIPEVITVGALNAKGGKSSYSTTGSSLWVSAPGGEFGVDKKWVDENLMRLGQPAKNWAAIRATAGDPAIVTTDVSGTLVGSSRFTNLNNPSAYMDLRNSFNACLVAENKDCNYTNTMNGTSSATPVTSGSIALILEANPNLTWRDVKYILAKTATKIDPDFKSILVTLPKGQVYNPETSTPTDAVYEAEQGWVVNAAGFHFSNWYGFGRVNVKDAVELAEKYDLNTLGAYIEKDWYPKYNAAYLSVPKGSAQGIVRTIDIPADDNLNIESIQIQVSAISQFIGDIGLELTSPSGTKSIIWHFGNAFSSNGNMSDMQIQSNAFYGEKSQGTWKLRVINSGIHDKDAIFQGWKIRVTGHKSGTLI